VADYFWTTLYIGGSTGYDTDGSTTVVILSAKSGLISRRTLSSRQFLQYAVKSNLPDQSLRHAICSTQKKRFERSRKK